jgi:hypothetical protein
MKVFGVLVVFSIILSGAALPSGGTNNLAEGTSSGVHLASPGQPADGDASSGAANRIVPPCPDIADVTKFFGQLSLLDMEVRNKALRDEIITNLDKLLLDIEGCMKDLEELQVSAEVIQPYTDYFEDQKKQVQEVLTRVSALNVPE